MKPFWKSVLEHLLALFVALLIVAAVIAVAIYSSDHHGAIHRAGLL